MDLTALYETWDVYSDRNLHLSEQQLRRIEQLAVAYGMERVDNALDDFLSGGGRDFSRFLRNAEKLITHAGISEW